MMLPGIFLNYRLKAAPSFMASLADKQRDIDTYMCIYIYFIKVKYIHILYMYIYMSGVREREEGHVNLNSHHVTPTELDINKKTINNS